MIMLTNHYKMKNNQWCMKFKFDFDDSTFSDVHQWFDSKFKKDEMWMGWKSDNTTLTVFLATEQAYAFSLLRWS